MKNILIIVILTVSFLKSFSQTNINLIKRNGVYEVNCKINTKSVNLILDSGASDVLISREFFLEGIKEGFFRNSDLFGIIKNFQIANGDIVQGRKINIREIRLSNLVLFNIEASIIDEPNTPMLLGQSVLERFGKYTIDYDKMLLSIDGNEKSKFEIELEKKRKIIGFEKSIDNQLKCVKIATELEFEVGNIILLPDNSIKFEIDITNNSNYDYNWMNGVFISYNLEVTTEDGKRYTSNDGNIHFNLQSGQTGNSWVIINIRGKKPINFRIFPKVVGLF